MDSNSMLFEIIVNLPVIADISTGMKIVCAENALVFCYAPYEYACDFCRAIPV